MKYYILLLVTFLQSNSIGAKNNNCNMASFKEEVYSLIKEQNKVKERIILFDELNYDGCNKEISKKSIRFRYGPPQNLRFYIYNKDVKSKVVIYNNENSEIVKSMIDSSSYDNIVSHYDIPVIEPVDFTIKYEVDESSSGLSCVIVTIDARKGKKLTPATKQHLKKIN